MRREGRQHGTVVYFNVSPPTTTTTSKVVNSFDSVPSNGCTTKVSAKPTNHSRYTSRCGRPRCRGCHTHPVSKAKAKAKGTHKLRSFDVALNHRLVSWRLVDQRPGFHDDDDWKKEWDAAENHEEDMVPNSMLVEFNIEEDGDFGFYEVGFVLELVDEEEWCLVGDLSL